MPPEVSPVTAAPAAFPVPHSTAGALSNTAPPPSPGHRDLQSNHHAAPFLWRRATVEVHELSGVLAAPDPKAPLRQRILSYLALPAEPDDKDMAGNPILTPSEAAVNEALRFLDLLSPRVPLPVVGRADDGEINFFWRRDGVFIDVGFYGDGHIHYLAQVLSLALDESESMTFPTPSLPRSLSVAIASLSRSE